MKFPKRSSLLIPIFLALSLTLLGLQTNLLSGDPEKDPVLKFLKDNGWYIFLLLVVVTVILTILNERKSEKNEDSNIYPPYRKKKKIESEINHINTRLSQLREKINKGTRAGKLLRFFTERRISALEKKKNELNEKLKKINQGLREFGADEVIRIQRLLSFKGWNIQIGDFKPVGTHKVEFYIQKGNELSPSNRLVHYVSGEADYSDIEDLREALKTTENLKGWLIYDRFNSQTKIEDDKISWERNDEWKPVSVFELNNFYFNEIFPLDNYFDVLQKDFKAQKISEYDVPVDGIQPVYDRKGDEIESNNINSINDYIDKWAESPGQNHIALFGDFGVGKTWFCKQYVLRQIELKNHRSLKKMPLLLFLDELEDSEENGNKANPKNLFRYFCEKYRIESVSYELFDELNKQGKFLLILDGLDEIADERNLERVYDELTKLCVANSKVMLTSRRTLFRDSKQRQNFIKHTRSREEKSEHAPIFEIIRLEEFDKSQIESFIYKRYGRKSKQYWEKLSDLGKGNLFKLAKTPVMLEIILSGFERGVRFGENDTAVELYEKFTSEWLRRATKTDNSLKDETRLKVIRLIAWLMFEKIEEEKIEKNDYSLPHDELSKFFSQLSSEEVKKTHDFLVNLTSETEPLESDVRKQSFLKRDSMGKYFFAHRSFLEYFVALQFASDINEGKKDSFAKHSISAEIINFLKDISINTETVFRWFDENRQIGGNTQNSCIQGNALTLLAKKKYVFAGRNLSHCSVKNADLSGANFEGCNFSASFFESVNLRDCNLNRTNFTGAVLEGLILGVRSPAKAVAFSPNGKFIASGRDNNAVVLIKKKNKIWETEKEIKGHTDSITNLTFDHKSELLASCGFDKTVCIFKLNNLRTVEILEHDETVYDAEFYGEGAPGGSETDFVFTASGTSIKLWRTKVLKDDVFAEEISNYTKHHKPVYKLTVSPDKKYLASAGFDKKVGLWRIVKTRNSLGLEFEKFLEDHRNSVNGVSFSPNGEYLASSDNDGKILIWSFGENKTVKIFEKHQGIVWDVSYSSSGNYLVSCSLDKTIRVWNMKKYEEIFALTGHSKNVWSVCFSPNEDLIVSSGFDNTVKIWNRSDGKCLQEIAMGEPTNGNFSCTGMILDDVKELSDFQKMYLSSCGAKI